VSYEVEAELAVGDTVFLAVGGDLSNQIVDVFTDRSQAEAWAESAPKRYKTENWDFGIDFGVREEIVGG
jgi:hypothetical protein